MSLWDDGLRTYLSAAQLQTIQQTLIGIGGCGGLGSNAALILARCGFCRFVLIDHDMVEASNLNRQQFFLNDIGQPKACCLEARIKTVNPAADCRVLVRRWSPDIHPDPFAECDLLIEAFDEAPTKTVFLETYQDRVSAVVCGNGLAGITGPAMTVRRQGNLFFVGDGISAVDQTHPPMAPRVTACAAMMADIVLALTLKQPLPVCDGGSTK